MARYDLSEGRFDTTGMRVGIVVARFNQWVTDALFEGALRALARHGLGEDRLTVVRVPGAFEIPLAARLLADTGVLEAIIALGAVIRGETAHFEYVAGECARGVSRVALDTCVPTIFGVLTVDDEDQARARIGGPEGHKGEEAALAALEMASLARALRPGPFPAAGPLTAGT